jgi:hypothetical protein
MPPEQKPDFSGTWRITAMSPSSGPLHYAQFTYEQKGADLRLIMRIEDKMGERVLDIRCKIDGQACEQECGDGPRTFRAAWEGDSLTWSLHRILPNGTLYNARKMYLSPDGRTISTDRIERRNDVETVLKETWTRE